ncbi:MAG: hypothetical protein PWP76_500 [Candidatus Diapherotrites archaeon]|nr:hypothetical protein [Candidatus Diapherotrites archaeon]MDN5367030.1 hypothetical protein [Candidatus Diapherotrites archaeon]
MRVLVIQSKDSDWDFSEKIREAVEGKVAPLELEFKTVPRFYDTLRAVSSTYDLNIVLFFPRKEEAAVAGPLLAELLKTGAKVVFYFAEDVGVYEDEILSMVLSFFGF